jgi:hypothetical protein
MEGKCRLARLEVDERGDWTLHVLGKGDKVREFVEQSFGGATGAVT